MLSTYHGETPQADDCLRMFVRLSVCEQCDELKEKYLLRASNAVAITRDQLAPCKQAVQDLAQQVGS